MIDRDGETTYIAIISLICVAILIPVLAGVYANGACLQEGWARGSVDYTLKPYCTKRIDGTDVTRPLEVIKGKTQ